MSWHTEWKAISDRVHGLLEAGRFFLSGALVNSSDPGSVTRRILIPQAQELFKVLSQFRDSYQAILPPSAGDSLNRFITEAPGYLENTALATEGHLHVQAVITLLTAFETEMAYHLADTSAVVRKLSERAFVHLQRSVVADSSVRNKWQEAFKESESACEKLGAVHLLQHGIWAFKTDAAGERTDLVLGEPLTDLSTVETVAEGLVLTEWKKVHPPSKLSSQIEQGKHQAERYSMGILAGFELSQYRYIVLVSEKHLNIPTDQRRDGIIFRHINIAVNPSTPSQH